MPDLQDHASMVWLEIEYSFKGYPPGNCLSYIFNTMAADNL